MFLNGFYRILTSAWTAVNPGIDVKSMAGSVENAQGATLDGLDGYLMAYSYPGSPSASIVVIFGTGNTPPAIDDYKLSGEIVQGVTLSSSSARGDSKTTVARTYTITNTNDNEITIGEVGIRYKLPKSTTATDEDYVLIERTILDEPITIPAGGVGSVTYRLDFVVPGGSDDL